MNPDLIPSHWTDDRELLSERLTAPPRLLVACDFDGTLAPLASEPDGAALPSATHELLRQLVATPGVHLAIISGRALADVRSRVLMPQVCFAGNHGLEIAGHGLDGAKAQARALEPRLTVMAGAIACRLAHLPGLFVENKQLSLAVHYRQVEPARWAEVVHVVGGLTAADPSFRVQSGHRVVEVLPSIGWDKGEALKQIAGRLGIPRSAVFYVGDDTTDEDAFRAVPNGTTVSVGADRPSAARWMARGTEDVRRLLAWVGDLRC